MKSGSFNGGAGLENVRGVGGACGFKLYLKLLLIYYSVLEWISSSIIYYYKKFSELIPVLFMACWEYGPSGT